MRKRNKGIILSYCNSLLSIIYGLFLSSFLLRTLGDQQYGIYQTISSFANYLVLLEFGTSTVLFRNIAICRAKGGNEEDIQKNVSTVLVVTIVLIILILLVSLVFYFSIDKIYSKTIMQSEMSNAKNLFLIITLFLIISFISQTLTGLPLAFEDYSLLPILNLIKSTVRVVALVLFITCFKAYIVIAIVDVSISFIMVIFLVFYCKKKYSITFKFKYFDKEIFRLSLPLSLAIFIQVIVNQANNNVDKFIIGIKINPETVALYSIAMYIYGTFSSLTTIPISMYSPQVSKDVVKGFRGKELTDRLIEPSRIIALIGGLILFGFISVGRQFITILYGSQYILAWTIALIIMLPMYINMSNGVLINVLDVLNKRLSRSYALLLTTIANIILTVIWIDKWGPVGAACATAVCTLLGQILIMNIYYSKVIGIKVLYLYKKTMHGILVYSILGSIFATVVSNYINNLYASFFISSFVFLITSIGGFICFGATKEEKLGLQVYLKKIKKK